MLPLALAAFAAVTAAPAIDPYALYARAQGFWTMQPYGAYLTYDVAVRVYQGGTSKVERYATLFDATTEQGTIYVNEISDYELAHPVVVRGINFCIVVTCVTKPLPPIDFLGVPLLTPTYTFGMAPFVRVPTPGSAESEAAVVDQVRRQFHDPYPHGRSPLQSANGLPTIAHAAAYETLPYVISYEGSEVVDGHECYHLSLQPREQPKRYRLRDLWIDEQTDATWRLRIALNFESGPGTASPWTVDFDNLNGIQYIARETAEEALHFQGQTYSTADVSFENVTTVRTLTSTYNRFNFLPGTQVQPMREPD